MLSEGTIPPLSDSKGICQCVVMYYRAMIASLSPPSLGYMSILNVCNSLTWDSQFQLHSRLAKWELWFPLNPHFSVASFTGPKVHWGGRWPMTGVLSDNHKFLLPCPAPSSNCSPPILSQLWLLWYSASLGMCVFFGQEGKGIGDKEMAGGCPPPLPGTVSISLQVIHPLCWKEGGQNSPQRPWS